MHEALKQGEGGASEEIRRRLQQSYDDEQLFDNPTRQLMREVGILAVFIKDATGKDWHSHAAARAAFESGIASLFAQRGFPAGPREFKPGELPSPRWVASDDPMVIGIACAANIGRGAGSSPFAQPGKDGGKL
jgi:hypothetical protein